MELNLSIEVNEDMFSEICTNTLENLPEEKLQEILLKAVEVALIEHAKSTPYSNTGILVTRYDQPTQLMNSILEKANFEKYFEPIAEKITSYINENFQNIVIAAITKCFVDVLFTPNNRYDFERRISSMIANSMK